MLFCTIICRKWSLFHGQYLICSSLGNFDPRRRSFSYIFSHPTQKPVYTGWVTDFTEHGQPRPDAYFYTLHHPFPPFLPTCNYCDCECDLQSELRRNTSCGKLLLCWCSPFKVCFYVFLLCWLVLLQILIQMYLFWKHKTVFCYKTWFG